MTTHTRTRRKQSRPHKWDIITAGSAFIFILGTALGIFVSPSGAPLIIDFAFVGMVLFGLTLFTIGTTKLWDMLKVGIAAFTVGTAVNISFQFLDPNWASDISTVAFLVALAGAITGIVGAVKAFGGLKAGVILLIAGVVLYPLGLGLIETAGTRPFLLGEIANYASPAYIIGQPMVMFGAIFGLVGLVMAVVTYLRRILRAVEGNKQNA